MIEAVARGGYDQTSVKQVIGLAGVSRRAFYEQFANKQECFLATFDAIVHRDIQRITRAYLATGGGLEDRLRAAFGAFAEMAHDNPKAILLVLVEAQTAGAAGTLRLHRVTATCEQLLARSFLEAPEACQLPAPIVRGITGGLHGAISKLLSAADADASSDLAEEMLRWTLHFQTPAAARMTERVRAPTAGRMCELQRPNAGGRGGAQASGADERERLLQSALRLALLHDYRELTAPQIADDADVAIDDFLELFADRDQCFLAALEMVGAELLGIAAAPELLCCDWPRAVRRVIGELLRHLADRPLYAQTIAQGAFLAGAQAAARNLELAHELATLLTKGAPSRAQCSPLVVAGVAGAFWHTVRCQVSSGRIRLLAAASDYLAYIVLAPFIGAEAAIEIVTEDRWP